VYGGTPAGICAAVAAKQEGMDVVLIEPSRWLGGILGAGIKPMQDCPEPRAVGGLTKSHVFEAGKTPPEIRDYFVRWMAEEEIPVIYEHRVGSASKDGTRIKQLTLDYAPPDEQGIPVAEPQKRAVTRIVADVYIDASYEGDLLPATGISYSFGRESSAKFGEEPAGVRPPTNWTPLDPYVVAGDASSDLLPLVDADHGKPLGSADDYTQAYNYRFYVTDDPTNRVPFTKPDDYSPAQFELVGRFVEHIVREWSGDAKQLAERLRGIFPGWRNSGEYNYQRKSLVTISPLGVSRFYQDGDWATRSKVWRMHRDYLRGLHYFMSTDPRVPESFRKATAELGLDRTMHPDTDGWPNQLYVRIARRMQSDYIVMHRDVLNQTTVDDGVGLALYGVDIYPVRRYAAHDPETGKLGVATEGNMFLGGGRGTGTPYAIPYRAVTPRTDECTNLLVPTCFSASFVAYASARMEPVFCVLGESVGVAAAQAINDKATVQTIEVPRLQKRLREREQVLHWAAPGS
jgi:hypothetical protein